MNRRGVADLGAVLVVSVTVAACVEGGTDSSASRGVGQSIGPFLDQILPPGASGTLVAAREGKRVYCKGFGMADRRARVPARCNTVYDAMSMTKQFTAAAILKLQMMGKLEVTDPIGKYIGPVPADKREITVQQLLTHTSAPMDALGGDS